MLSNLSVRNFALVKELSIPLTQGLTVLTGESGAGKSILLDALSLVLGNRATRNQIRPETPQCEVAAEFSLDRSPASMAYLKEQSLEDQHEPNACLVRRITTDDGRSRAWINGSPVNVSTLRELCSPMVEIHGQFSQQQILQPTIQLKWLDEYCSEESLASEVVSAYSDWHALKTKYEQQVNELAASQTRLALLQHELNEFTDLALQDNEFESLTSRHRRLLKLSDTLIKVDQCVQLIDARSHTAIQQAKSLLHAIDDDSSELTAVRDFLESVEINSEEASSSLHRYHEELNVDAGEEETIRTRLDQIHHLARKHKIHPRDLATRHREIQADIHQLNELQHTSKVLATEVESKESTYFNLATRLSATRHEGAQSLSIDVLSVLDTLGIKDAKFEVNFTPTVYEHGLERVEYCIATVSHYQPKPLREVASAGEMSRISLAILVVVARRSKLPCLILDEADLGVGGTTADVVGRFLRELSLSTQIVCVTHAPQVAALAANHLRVYKTNQEDVGVSQLPPEKRVEEIARMVGGRKIDAEARQYAKALLSQAAT